MIPDGDIFKATVEAALPAAQAGQLVTFGINPDRPETGYGYLELEKAPTGEAVPTPLKAFVEKPDEATAIKMLAEGRYLWNAGIFLFSVKSIVAAYTKHVQVLFKRSQQYLEGENFTGSYR